MKRLDSLNSLILTFISSSISKFFEDISVSAFKRLERQILIKNDNVWSDGRVPPNLKSLRKTYTG